MLPHGLSCFPAFFSFTLLALNFLGDGLRDAWIKNHQGLMKLLEIKNLVPIFMFEQEPFERLMAFPFRLNKEKLLALWENQAQENR